MARELENRLSSILAWGALAVTILVTDRISLDPVNVGKMLLLSIVALSVFPIILIQRKDLVIRNRVLLFAQLTFILLAFISIFTSDNAFERGLYGAFGRNTGLLTYTCLVILFLAATLFSLNQSFDKIILSLFLAGILNIIYCLLVVSGNDFLTWNNTYNAVLGTFGNPNFIGAFMGIFFTLLIVQILNPKSVVKIKLLLGALLPFVIAVIYFSHALQGILVAASGSVLALYFLIRSKQRLAKASVIFLTGVFGIGFLALLGIIQKGPLATILYKPSVTFRGEYWKAGINMGEENPLTGVGIDSYGTYYRTFREQSATIKPGLETVTDTAHNVYLDIFAGLGFPGLLTFIIINMFVLFIALRHLHKFKDFDARFLSIFLCWTMYQLQSIISINQIGLAIWGWLLGGLIIAYVHSYPKRNLDNEKIYSRRNVKKKHIKNQRDELIDASTTLKILLGAVVGLLVALPSFVVDVQVRNALYGKGDSSSVVAVAKMWPADNVRLNRIFVALAEKRQNQEARDLTVFSISKFPNDYPSWRALYLLTLDGVPEKVTIKNKLHEIDPFNPEYFEK